MYIKWSRLVEIIQKPDCLKTGLVYGVQKLDKSSFLTSEIRTFGFQMFDKLFGCQTVPILDTSDNRTKSFGFVKHQTGLD